MIKHSSPAVRRRVWMLPLRARIAAAAMLVAFVASLVVGASVGALLGDDPKATAVTKVGAFAGTPIFPSAITGAVDDWNPTGLDNATTIFVSTSGATTLSGIAGGVSGRQLDLCNAGTFAITLVNDQLSTAANRFLLPDALSWQLDAAGNACASLVYDGTASRWKVRGRTGITFPGLTVSGIASVQDFRYTILSPTSLGSGNVDNYSPTGLATASVLRLTSSGNISLRGIDSSGSGDGRMLWIYNANASATISLITNSGGSSANNQITVWGGNASVAIPTASAQLLIYSTAVNKWLAMNTSRVPSIVVDGTTTLTGAVTSSRITGSGTTPTPSSCGTGAAAVGNDMDWQVTVGSAATGCVMTFATTWGANAPICLVVSPPGIAFTYTVSATAVTITAVGALSSTVLVGHCFGR